MKLTKTTLFIALTMTVLSSSCMKKEAVDYICRCTGNPKGQVETYRIATTKFEDAKEQCKGFGQAPGADSTTCVLE